MFVSASQHADPIDAGSDPVNVYYAEFIYAMNEMGELEGELHKKHW